jgi:hypothetical protein
VVGVRRTKNNQKRRKIMKSRKSSKLPIQAAPVVRTIAGAAISNEKGDGVEASFAWLAPLLSAIL